MAAPIKAVNPDGEVQSLTCNDDGFLNTTAVINVDTVNIQGDGALLDGVDSDIRATVKDYTNSNPLAVVLVAPTSGTAISTLDVATEEQLDYDTGAGTVPLSLIGLGLPASGGPVAGGTNTNPIQVGDGGSTLSIDDGAGNISIDDGGNSITVDNGGTFATQATLQTGSNLAGRVNLDAQTGNGCDVFRSLDLDESEEQVKGSAGAVYGYHFVNRTTSPLYLKFYNDTAANVTVGSTTPVMTLELPANATDHIAGHISFAIAVKFDTAITVAVTTGFADNDSGAPGANHAIVHVFYK